MKLSIIIVNYNVKYFLEQCLDSVFLAGKNLPIEVFVVDNCSSDGSTEYVKPMFPDVIYIENQENVGFSKANNQAIAQARGEYILLLNPDTVIGENSLTDVCRFMDENPQAGAVGVKMLDGYGQFLPESKRGFPSPWNSFCKMSGLSKLFPYSKRFGGYHLKYLDKNRIHPVDILAGAFMMVRKEAIEKSGYLDERFFMYGEDIDWSYRIARSGYTNYYFPEPIIHYKGESTKKDIKYVKRFYEAMLLFFNKHYPHSNRFFKSVIRLAIVACGTISGLQKATKPFKAFFPARKAIKEFTFDKSVISYEQIIRTMDQYSGEKTRFGIRHPEKGITITSNEIIIDNTI
ncbi:MAG: glycosyltransferase family 2 protein [Candidatus Azobacteroides sp.]|nr:glycosyltransferase family 2 protein [Candidatus Azobacteroides sp.]